MQNKVKDRHILGPFYQFWSCFCELHLKEKIDWIILSFQYKPYSKEYIFNLNHSPWITGNNAVNNVSCTEQSFCFIRPQ